MAENLKFPSGEFTHTELAKHNGKTNQQVWTRYQAAIKSGQIVTAGERASAGRGKPSKLWKLDPNWVAPVVPVVVAPATPATPPAPVAPAPTAPAASAPEADENIVLPTEEQIAAATAPVASPAPAPVAEVTPAPEVTATPAVVETPATVVETPAAEVAASIPPVVIAEVTPAPEVIPAVAEAAAPEVVTNIVTPTASAQVANARTMKETCPVCKSPLFSIDDATGVMVWCGQSIEVCSSTENPYGHGRNEKEALEVLNQKWDRAMAGTAAA